MSLPTPLLLALALLLPGVAQASGLHTFKPIEPFAGRTALQSKLRAMGYRTHGGIDKGKTDHEDARNQSFPHFSSAFSFGGTSYPFTMVGHPPASGRSTTTRTVIIPLRMQFVGFQQDVTFEPGPAVDNIVASPIFQEAHFANGKGQFGDQLQRATFWNKMDREHQWHVQLAQPRITRPVDVRIESDIGELSVGIDGTVLGNARFGAVDSTVHTILQFAQVEPDELPIFVTHNVSFDALGYHDAFVVGHDDGTDVLQTLLVTSWLDLAAVGDLLADVSTINHEIGEWLNDPYVNNLTPNWNFPKSTICGQNGFLEVGDPQGNGPNFADFPTVPITLKGVTYHLQDLVMLPWFTGEVPSSAQNGWYDFPDTRQITTPFTLCGP